MVFSWFKADRRKELLAEPLPAAWGEYLVSNVRHYQFLRRLSQDVVQAVVQVMVGEKSWTGAGGLTVTDEMKVTIAGQAAVLTLGLDEPYYFDRVQSIILYPRAYVHPPRVERNLNLPVGVRLGEAWYHSPIVLSWEHVLQAGRDQSNGCNVVLHEFAHHLDGLDGEMEGTPPLAGREQEKTWYRVTEAEYRRLVGSARRHEVTLLDHYGATNRAEFFAVATECFFEQPHAMQRRHEELYAVLRDFYLQDPAEWLPDAAVDPSKRRPRSAEEDDLADAALLRSDDADALFTLAVTCLGEGRYALAEQAASRAIELDPTDGEAYQYRAAARIKLGDFAAALQDCDRAIGCDDSDLDAYRTRGGAYLGLHEYELAKADLDYVLSENTNDAQAYLFRGAALLGLDQFRPALSDFSMSIALNPLSAEAYYQRSLACRRLDRAEDADADLEKATQLDPEVGRRQ